MGQFSHKGPPLVPVALPCSECEKPCCRQGNGADVMHRWPAATRINGQAVPYTASGVCPHLCFTGCTLQATKPAPCVAFDCRQPLFRHQHPAVDALLKRHGL